MPTSLSRDARLAEPDHIIVGAIMSTEIESVSPDLLVSSVRDLLLATGWSAVPVIDANDELVGMVSKSDILSSDQALDRALEVHAEDDAAITDEEFMLFVLPQGCLVAEIMSSSVLAIPASASVGRAAALLSYEGIQQAPVVSDVGIVVGMIHAEDILRWLATNSGYVVPEVSQTARLHRADPALPSSASRERGIR